MHISRPLLQRFLSDFTAGFTRGVVIVLFCAQSRRPLPHFPPTHLLSVVYVPAPVGGAWWGWFANTHHANKIGESCGRSSIVGTKVRTCELPKCVRPAIAAAAVRGEVHHGISHGSRLWAYWMECVEQVEIRAGAAYLTACAMITGTVLGWQLMRTSERKYGQVRIKPEVKCSLTLAARIATFCCLNPLLCQKCVHLHLV